MSRNVRDHGGGIDAARRIHGGARAEWLDLSTGINPCPYPFRPPSPEAWTALPDRDAEAALNASARRHWSVPADAEVVAAPGASALIARLPGLAPPGRVLVPSPTYNEHAAAFRQAGWDVAEDPSHPGPFDAAVVVHPNNPDGRLWEAAALPPAPFLVIDESFCDVRPEASLVALSSRPGVVVLKSFGKFWGLAGLRLGFAICAPDTARRLADALGPWPVAGPALEIGTAALSDRPWAKATRRALADGARRLDALMAAAGAALVGGTDLFRLYRVRDAEEMAVALARHRILVRTFPYDRGLVRLGL
ncbi:MAG: threonine-phosphate decarboxylase, partial [Alphaproteobacteria bacterium]